MVSLLVPACCWKMAGCCWLGKKKTKREEERCCCWPEGRRGLLAGKKWCWLLEEHKPGCWLEDASCWWKNKEKEGRSLLLVVAGIEEKLLVIAGKSPAELLESGVTTGLGG